MHTLLNQRSDRHRQRSNAKLLDAFYNAYSDKNIERLSKLLHNYGVFFRSMNKRMALNYFQQLLFGANGIKNKFHITCYEGISCDSLPGEIVLEIRSSDWNPFSRDIPWNSKKFGDPEDSEMNEVVKQFAITIKDGKLFTIRTPDKCMDLDDPLIELN